MDRPSAAVGALWVAHRGELVAFAERRLGSRALAEDVVQQAGLRAFEGADGLRSLQTGRAWLFQITRRLVVEQFRGSADVGPSLELAPVPERVEFACGCVVSQPAPAQAGVHPSAPSRGYRRSACDRACRRTRALGQCGHRPAQSCSGSAASSAPEALRLELAS